MPATYRNLVISADRRRFWFNLTPEDRALCVMPLYYSQGSKEACSRPSSSAEASPVPIAKPMAMSSTGWSICNPRGMMRRANLPHDRPGMRAGATRNAAAPLPAIHPVGRRAAFRDVARGLEEVLECLFWRLTASARQEPWPPIPSRRRAESRGPSAGRGRTRSLFAPRMGVCCRRARRAKLSCAGRLLMPGYLYDEDANRAAFVDGWFRTGDLGSIDAEGFLTLLGRLKEFINRGGEKISPYEIERALLLHPCVREAAAFSFRILGWVKMWRRQLFWCPERIQRQRKSKHSSPSIWHRSRFHSMCFVKAKIPKGDTGKALRRQLSEEAAHRIPNVVPPETLLQVQILDIWQRLIGRSDIGIDDDFFEVGGDSLLATQMICDVETITRQHIPLSALKAVFTVRELEAAVLRGSPPTVELMTCAKRWQRNAFIFLPWRFSGVAGSMRSSWQIC